MAYLLVATLLVLIGLVWLVKAILAALPPRLDFPVVGSPGDADFRSAVIEGVKKVRHKISERCGLCVLRIFASIQPALSSFLSSLRESLCQ